MHIIVTHTYSICIHRQTNQLTGYTSLNVFLVGQPTCTVRAREICSAVQELGALRTVNLTVVDPCVYVHQSATK